ncbi:MAG: hypothetical protein WC763_00680 [Candidatus Paceibacterota bacterium]|jgi:hypothetical protein
MNMSHPVRLDGVFGPLDFNVRIDANSLSILLPVDGEVLEAVSTLPLDGVKIDQYEFSKMLKEARAELIAGTKGIKFSGIRLKLSGGYRIKGGMTVKPTFVFDVPFREKPRDEFTVLPHGWKPISNQLMAFQNFLTSGDRTKDVTDFYFREGR